MTQISERLQRLGEHLEKAHEDKTPENRPLAVTHGQLRDLVEVAADGDLRSHFVDVLKKLEGSHDGRKVAVPFGVLRTLAGSVRPAPRDQPDPASQPSEPPQEPTPVRIEQPQTAPTPEITPPPEAASDPNAEPGETA